MNIPKIKMLVLSLTGQCNFACKYCYAAEHDGSMLKVWRQAAEKNLLFSSAVVSRC